MTQEYHIEKADSANVKKIAERIFEAIHGRPVASIDRPDPRDNTYDESMSDIMEALLCLVQFHMSLSCQDDRTGIVEERIPRMLKEANLLAAECAQVEEALKQYNEGLKH